MRSSFLIALLGAIFFMSGCGSKKPTPTNLSIMVPLTALTSPVASSNGSGPSYSSVVTDITDRLAKTNSNSCYSNIGVTPVYSTISCMGPAINYDNHPNGAATNGTSTDCTAGGSGCLLKGDTGIFSNNDALSSEACMVAQTNFLTTDLAYLVNTGLKYAAGTICAAQLGGIAMPAIGETTSVSTAAQDAMLTGTISSASIGKLADISGGMETYKISYSIAQGPIRHVVTLIHSTLPDKTAYKGRIYGYVDLNYSTFSSVLEFPTSADRKFFSAIYDFQSGVLKFVIDSVTMPTSTSPSGVIDSNGNLTYTQFLAGTYPNSRESRYLRNSITVATGVGTSYIGWQNKPTETYARLIKLEAGASTGFGYFGFSAKAGQAGYGSTIGGMFCNWAGPGASLGAYQTTNVPSQSFTLALGLFGASTSNVTHAPTNTCNTSGGTFKYGTNATYSGASVGPTVNNNFTNQTALGTVTAITAPVYP